MPAPFFYSSAVNTLFWCFLGQICMILLQFNSIIKQIESISAPSEGAIWEEHQHQSIETAPYLMPN